LSEFKKDKIIDEIKKITGKSISIEDFIYGPNSSLKSIEFIQIIAFIEDEFISSENIDLLFEFSNQFQEASLYDLLEFIKKWT